MSEAQQRRSFLLALLWSQGPVLVLWLGLFLLAVLLHEPVQWHRLIAPPVAALGSAYGLWPGRRPWHRLPAAAALFLGGLAGPITLAIAVAMLFAADALAGPAAQAPRAARSPRRTAAAMGLPLRITLRAGGMGLLRAYLPAALTLILTWFYLHNNELSGGQFALGVRAGCGLGAVFLLQQLAADLRGLRPPWGWCRSLPWTAKRRVLQDATFFLAAALPLTAAAGWLHPPSMAPVAVLSAYCSLRLASSLRPQHGHLTRLGAWRVVETLAAALATAVTSWSMALFVLLLPWALRAAVTREQRLKVGLWLEREHTAAGDPIT